MDYLPSFLVHALELPPLLKYGTITLISMFEGPILFTVAGFFLRLGTEQFMPVAIALGNFIGDTMWYCFGYFFAGRMIRKRGSFMGITTDHLLTAERIFGRYRGRILFLTKATLGFGTSVGIPAMLISAGMLKMPFSKYMKYNIAGEVLLLVIFMTIGYVFGLSYESVSRDMRVVTMASLFVLLAVGLFFIRSYLAKKRPLT